MPGVGPQHLEYFLAVYRHRSIGRAAEALNLTQPAIAKSIAKLEATFGVPLFDRLPRGVAPTVFGESFARHANLMRVELQHAVHEIDALRGARRGHLTVGAVPTVVGDILPTAISRMLTQRPDLHFRIVTGLSDALLRALREGQLDLAVTAVEEGLQDPEIESLPLIHDTLKVAARSKHPLARRRKVALKELLAYPWVLIGSVAHLHARLDAVFIAHGLSPPKPVIESDSFQYAISHLRRSDSLSFQASQLILRGEASGLVTLNVAEATWYRTTGVSYRRRGSLSPIALALIEELKRASARALLPKYR